MLVFEILAGFVALVGAVCGYLFTQRAKYIDLPGPPWHWFWGTLKLFKANLPRTYDFRLECARKYGERGMWRSGLPFRPSTIYLTDPALVEYILKTNFENYIKSKSGFDRSREFFGYGIFAVNGEEWSFQRKTASHMFSMRSLRDTMFPNFITTGNKIMMNIDKHVKKGDKFDIQELFFRATMDAICEIAFGENVGCLDAERMPQFAKSFDIVQAQVIKRFMDPFWKIKRFFQIGEREKLIKENCAAVNKLAYSIVNKRRQEIREGKKIKEDLLSKFLDYGKKNNKEMTDELLRDVVFSFIIAGRDTTACALTWTIYELCHHSNISETVRKEIDPWDEIDYTNVSRNMKFGEACFMEALRLHPSVPAESMTARSDDKLPNGFQVKAGTILSYDPYVVNRNPKVYDAPEKFEPKRWLAKETTPTQYEYPTFNGGPRLCLGKHVAILEAKTFLAQLLRKYDFELVPDQDFHYAISILLPIKRGLWVTAKERTRNY